MSTFNIKGMGVALVTPFKRDKSIDYEALERLLEYQIGHQTDYLVVMGTTGETPTLFSEEREAVRRFVADKVAGRIPLVVGLGGNNTAAVIREMKGTDLSAFSAILSVVPFYNKPSQEGMYQHYATIAQESPLPVILYNVPGRTGVNMLPATTLRLARDFENIIAVKEASGNIMQMDDIIKNKPERFSVVSGDDGITYPLITLGADGVISVIGNAFPAEFAKMVHLALAGDYESALPIHHRYADLLKLLFVDGNPAGIKSLMHAMGLIENELRLPLVPTREETYQKICAELERVRGVHANHA